MLRDRLAIVLCVMGLAACHGSAGDPCKGPTGCMLGLECIDATCVDPAVYAAARKAQQAAEMEVLVKQLKALQAEQTFLEAERTMLEQERRALDKKLDAVTKQAEKARLPTEQPPLAAPHKAP